VASEEGIMEKLLKMDWEVVTNYMDAEIAQIVHTELAPCTNEEFLKRYIELHEEKYNEVFDIN
jgi:hypothetical protein